MAEGGDAILELFHTADALTAENEALRWLTVRTASLAAAFDLNGELCAGATAEKALLFAEAVATHQPRVPVDPAAALGEVSALSDSWAAIGDCLASKVMLFAVTCGDTHGAAMAAAGHAVAEAARRGSSEPRAEAKVLRAEATYDRHHPASPAQRAGRHAAIPAAPGKEHAAVIARLRMQLDDTRRVAQQQKVELAALGAECTKATTEASRLRSEELKWRTTCRQLHARLLRRGDAGDDRRSQDPPRSPSRGAKDTPVKTTPVKGKDTHVVTLAAIAADLAELQGATDRILHAAPAVTPRPDRGSSAVARAAMLWAEGAVAAVGERLDATLEAAAVVPVAPVRAPDQAAKLRALSESLQEMRRRLQQGLGDLRAQAAAFKRERVQWMKSLQAREAAVAAREAAVAP